MKKITTSQILLISIATVVFLLSAYSFYLLSDPTASLPFSAPSPTTSLVPQGNSDANGGIASPTSLPTRQTSYTPLAAMRTPVSENLPGTTPVPTANTTAPLATTQPGAPTSTFIPQPGSTNTLQPVITFAPATSPAPTTPSGSPTPTQTLMPGQYGVTGRIVQNGTPVPNVVVRFMDDEPPRVNTTNQGGHYWFTSFAPGTSFTMEFSQMDNPPITPITSTASLAYIEGSLFTGDNVIDLPDLDININVGGMFFELQAPVDGATYPAAVISSSNPVQFSWTTYNQGISYHVELGANGSRDPIWTSSETTSTNTMWNGTLNNGNRIVEGAYWWRAGVKKIVGNYTLFIFTRTSDILFNP